MSQEVPEGRISVSELTGQTKTVVDKPETPRRQVTQESDKPSDVELARSGRDQKFLTFVSKVRGLLLYRTCETTVITKDMRTHVQAAKTIRFVNWIFKCETAEEEQWMLASPEFNKRFWTHTDYVKMINSEKVRAMANETAHQKLLAKELAGNVDARDRDLNVGLRSAPDSLREEATDRAPNDGD